ncbi:MAG: penicillin-binding protein [Bdellovibrionaceae bacterium]|nr:penicillin-binding protein [Pseudobdellovibrionaceae bacterium]
MSFTFDRKIKIQLGLLTCLAVAFVTLTAFNYEDSEIEVISKHVKRNLEQRTQISNTMSKFIKSSQFPTEAEFDWYDRKDKFQISYTIDERLQSEADLLFKRYRPDYGAIVLLDASNGRVLALSSYEKGNPSASHLALRATYPAASLFKIITASAAVEKAGVTPYHSIHFNGANYTLYKKNVMTDKVNRWTRKITLKEAFARSINTAFGRLSLEMLEPADLLDFANRFMFNQHIPTDFEVDQGYAHVPTEKNYELTQVASGFNRINRISPVQGAMIAAAVVNDGKMLVPYVVDQLTNPEGDVFYKGEPLEKGYIMTAESAAQMRKMMEQTVIGGTSRKSFRNLVRDRRFSEIEMGGKTGHLTGDNPKGRVDWFVGYATDAQNRKLAVAAITISKKFWTVKSSYIGQHMFRTYFEPVVKKKTVATNH